MVSKLNFRKPDGEFHLKSRDKFKDETLDYLSLDKTQKHNLLVVQYELIEVIGKCFESWLSEEHLKDLLKASYSASIKGEYSELNSAIIAADISIMLGGHPINISLLTDFKETEKYNNLPDYIKEEVIPSEFRLLIRRYINWNLSIKESESKEYFQ